MAKYTCTITLHTVNISIDTDDFGDVFNKSDDNPEPLDGADPDVVHDWIVDNWQDYELIDVYGDIEIDQVAVRPDK